MSTAVPEAAEFGETMRQFRDDHGWTRRDLVLRLQQVDPDGSWTVQRITHLEHGNVRHPPLRLIRLLSIVFGCDPNDLVWPRRTAWYGDSPGDQRIHPHQVDAEHTLVKAA